MACIYRPPALYYSRFPWLANNILAKGGCRLTDADAHKHDCYDVYLVLVRGMVNIVGRELDFYANFTDIPSPCDSLTRAAVEALAHTTWAHYLGHSALSRLSPFTWMLALLHSNPRRQVDTLHCLGWVPRQEWTSEPAILFLMSFSAFNLHINLNHTNFLLFASHARTHNHIILFHGSAVFVLSAAAASSAFRVPCGWVYSADGLRLAGGVGAAKGARHRQQFRPRRQQELGFLFAVSPVPMLLRRDLSLLLLSSSSCGLENKFGLFSIC